ncbi:MAG: signal peptidase I [Nocardioides sp.]
MTSTDFSAAGRKSKKHLPLWQETILLLVIALGLSVAIKAILLQAFYIPSESMEPGLVKNDRILVQKVSYWGSGEPKRGDVVVFKDPGGWLNGIDDPSQSNMVTKVMSKIGLYPAGGHLVKRVVGVAGDVVECCDKKGRIKINGVAIEEGGYIKNSPGMACNGPMKNNCDWQTITIPPGQLFVMGDNRANSADSSFHMCRTDATDCEPGDEFVPVDLVVGKVFAVVWPRPNWRWVERADSFGAVPTRK